MPVVRGKQVEVGALKVGELEKIASALNNPENYIPLGCVRAPTIDEINNLTIQFSRGAHTRKEPVRFSAIRERNSERFIGFFLDFPWEHPGDSTREIDLVIVNKEDRRADYYLDATIAVCQYLFRNRLAKRLRWRITVRDGKKKRRNLWKGARFLWQQKEQHPVTGKWLQQEVYEFAFADYDKLLKQTGVDERVDYGDAPQTVWQAYRGS